MGKFEHTPGPWGWGRFNQGLYGAYGVGPDNEVLAWAAYEGMWLSGPNREANARLIAAAPDLLEAAVHARDIAMEYAAKARIPECGKFAQIAQELDAAIAKATGGIRNDP